ncbi:hypothetical protein HanPI659440_Chr10g0385811 [Helianthus annuus]|nr:hypothetical protein HanPI659440_Chr10g0385811 [Helianthus annuus]
MQPRYVNTIHALFVHDNLSYRTIVLYFLHPFIGTLKFEHCNSKGCNYGPPYEWQVYISLNGCYGIPWVHYKGRQGHGYAQTECLGCLEFIRLIVRRTDMLACFAIEAISIVEKLHSKG